MATISQTLKFGAVVDQGVSAIEQVSKALLAQGVQLKNLTVSSVEANNAGLVLKATVKGLTETGFQYVGTLERLTTTVGEGKEAVKRLNANLSITKNVLKDVVVATDSATSSTEKLQTAQDNAARAAQKLQKEQAKTAKEQAKAVADRILDIEREARADLKAAQAAIKNQQLRVEQRNRLLTVTGADSQIRELFPAPNNANVRQLQTYESSIGSAISILRTGKVTVDQFANSLNNVKNGTPDGSKLTNELFKTKTAFEEANVAAKGYLLTFKDVIRIIEATAIKTFFGKITQEITEGIETARKYQIAISEIRTISQSNQVSFSGWSNEIRKVSDLLKLPIADVAEANYQAISNQVVKGAESFEFLARAGDLARVSQSTLTQSVSALSSVFNAYNLSVGDSERVSAGLFKAVELGRFRLSEIADTLGRVTFLGKTLGVTLEEVEAGLATLTIQGVKASDASTLLTNIFQKLLRPTERMKAVFKELGVASGQAAIETYGFTGVIQRLIDLAKRGDVDIGELFNEIRGRKGFEALSNFEGEFQKTLGQITNSVKDYRNAIKIRAESPADFLTGELNKIKNTAINDLGQPFLELSATVVKSVKASTEGLDEYLPSLRTTTLALGVFTTAQLVGTAATLGYASATRVANAALLAAPYTIIAASLAYYTAKAIEGRRATKDVSDALRGLKETQDDIERSKTTSAGTTNFFQTGQNVTKQFGDIFQNVARVQTTVDASLNNIRTKTDIIDNSLKLVFKSYYDQLNNAIQTTNRSITQTRDNLKSSTSAIPEFRKAVEEANFQEQLKFSTPEQQRQLERNRISQLKQEIEALAVSTGNPEKDAENEKLIKEKFNEVLKLTLSLQEKIAALVGNTQIISRGNVETNIELNNLLKFQESIYTRIGVSQEKNLQNLEKEKQSQKDKEALIQQIARDFEGFRLFDKDGAIRKDFQNVGGQLDPDKALAAFANISERLRAALGSDAGAQVNLLNLIETKKFSIIREAELLKTKFLTERARVNIENQKKSSDAELKAAQDAATSAVTKAFGKGGATERLGSGGLLDAIGDFRGSNPIVGEIIKGALGGNNDQVLKTRTAQGNVDIARKAFVDALTNLNAKKENIGGFEVANEKDIQSLELAERNLTQAILDLQKIRAGDPTIDARGTTINTTDGKSSASLGSVIDEIRAQIQEIKTARTKVIGAEGTRNAVDTATNLLGDNTIIKQFKDQFPTLIDDFEKQVPRLQTGFGSIKSSVSEVIKEIERLKGTINDLNLDKIPTKKISVANFNNVDDDVEYFASGGVVGLHPGGPRGTDTEPAWLTRGERVLTVAQNRQYEKLMVSLRSHSTLQPRYYSQGGAVTTVGDINISVSNKSQQPAMLQFATQLQRVLKRQGIKL